MHRRNLTPRCGCTFVPHAENGLRVPPRSLAELFWKDKARPAWALCYRFGIPENDAQPAAPAAPKSTSITIRFIGPDGQDINLGTYEAVPRIELECLREIAAAAKASHKTYFDYQSHPGQDAGRSLALTAALKSLGEKINTLDTARSRLAAITE
jgi:hypothetical protein